MPQPPDPANSPTVRVVITTFAREEEAAETIRTLVREQLAACGTILRGARSIYSWNGQMEDSEEVLVILKSSVPAALTDRLSTIHSYEIPEILTVTPEAVSAPYAEWVRKACASMP